MIRGLLNMWSRGSGDSHVQSGGADGDEPMKPACRRTGDNVGSDAVAAADTECPVCFETLAPGLPRSVRMGCCGKVACHGCYADLVAFGAAQGAEACCPMCNGCVGEDLLAKFGALSAAAEQGNPNAQLELGLWYLNGKGVLKDRAVAQSFFEKAAVAGNPTAMRLAKATAEPLPAASTNGAETKTPSKDAVATATTAATTTPAKGIATAGGGKTAGKKRGKKKRGGGRKARQ